MPKVLNFKQELVGCFGQPVAENPTQAMVEAAFRHHGLDWRYLTIEVAPADLAAAVAGTRAMGFRGFNCTIPHKIAVIPQLDGLGDSADLMGAVNCVVARGRRLIGENTDGKGFVAGVRRLADPAGKLMVLLGAGGAARAIAVEMALAGVHHVTVVSRDAAQGRALVELLDGKVRAAAGASCRRPTPCGAATMPCRRALTSWSTRPRSACTRTSTPAWRLTSAPCALA
jgi:shikimate dehydrogenase